MEQARLGARRLAQLVVFGFVLVAAVSCSDQESASPTSRPDATETTSADKTTTEPTTRQPKIHDIVIPAGTASQLAAGAKVDVIPKRIEVRAGDKLRVKNEDSEEARLGLFDVAPGETVSMAFNTPGEFEGVIFSTESAGCGGIPKGAETFTVAVKP